MTILHVCSMKQRVTVLQIKLELINKLLGCSTSLIKSGLL